MLTIRAYLNIKRNMRGEREKETRSSRVHMTLYGKGEAGISPAFSLASYDSNIGFPAPYDPDPGLPVPYLASGLRGGNSFLCGESAAKGVLMRALPESPV